MTFNVVYLNEPKLKFLNGESYNPCAGLLKFGPRFASTDEKGHKWLKIGIIGSGQSVSSVLNLLDDMRYACVPIKTTKWNLPFPGLNEKSPLKFSLSYKPEWQQKITSDEIVEILKEKKRGKRVEILLELIDKKIKVLDEKSPAPDVIIISIPKELEDACKDPNFERPLIKLDNEDDYHNRIKLYGIKHKIPTQLIRPDTIELKGTQEKNIVYWNLAVGLLYKSQKGFPWKLAELEDNTCYVGISFFKERESKNKYLRASMAQVFLDTGESFILRGEPFEWKNERKEKYPHLSKGDAKDLLIKVFNQYKSVKGHLPERLVIHKSSNYWDEELDGFKEASKGVKYKDFITLQFSSLKFYREGQYGVLRGTLITSPNSKEHHLYTTGFVPSINTYPGLGVPRPLLVRCFVQDSDISKICKEILAFTKLDWNNTFIYRKEPVTLEVARRVGKVLAETGAKELEDLDPHYYFYM